jgi:hypothetical protein
VPSSRLSLQPFSGTLSSDSFRSPQRCRCPPQFTNPNGHLIKGWYDESAPRFFRDWKGSIALLHIDCDLYSSTAIAFRYALDHCGHETVVLFDEYYNYPGFAGHEWLAWREAKDEHGILARCIAYDGRRAAFQITTTQGQVRRTPDGR